MFNFGSLFSGIGSFFGGMEEASGYRDAAKFYGEAADMTKLGGQLKDVATVRNIQQVVGGTKAIAAGGNLALSGSALQAVHSNIQQGYLTKAITDLNTQLQYKSYLAQQSQANSAAKAAEFGGIMGGIGGIIGFFSDDSLKSDVSLVFRRPDGIGMYRFRYNGSQTYYIGVMASEIETLRPDAILRVGEHRRVNYEALGIEFNEERAYA